MKNYIKICEQLDPIIKNQPKINYTQLQKEYPDLAAEISYRSFGRRRHVVLGLEGYGINKKNKKRERVMKEATKDTVEVFLNTVLLQNSDRKEYLKIIEILKKDPDVLYDSAVREHNLSLDSQTFKNFQKEYLNWFRKDSEESVKVPKKRKVRQYIRSGKYERKKTHRTTEPQTREFLYLVIFSEELTENDDSTLLQKFIKSVNSNNTMKWQYREVFDPETQKKYVEIRQIAR